MEIGRIEGRNIVRDRYIKETVRLAGGLDKNGALTPEAIETGSACLSRFRTHLEGIPPQNIRAVATNTLRVATNPQDFLKRAEAALGCNIDIIPGREEARLIYAGVAHLLPYTETPRFVVDIGGGSTEMIIGRGFDPIEVESFKLGSVSETRTHFADGKLTEITLKRAQVAVLATLEEAKQRFASVHWKEAYGSSGTAGAIAEIARANNWSDGTITKAVLAKLRKALLEAGKPERVKLAGLKADRVPVIAGGYTVLAGVFETLDIPELKPARGALRHGVLYQLLDRRLGSDQRESAILALCRRFNVDLAQADRVKFHAEKIHTMLATTASRRLIKRPTTHTYDAANALAEKILSWAALTHELGFAVSHGSYHRHSAYVLANSDLNGFAPGEQKWLADLVLAHRGNLQKASEWLANRLHFQNQLLALRLAAILCHARVSPKQSPFIVATVGKTISIKVIPTYSTKHPETLHLLREETLFWAAIGVKLMVS
jgi:exopolyphosphatase / guanosine-5'-triphosphate,3'-diphosphate pyrophosphatase